MTKADLVDEVAQNSGLTRKDTKVVVKTVLESIKNALNSGEGVELRGFGSFRFQNRSSRRARDPNSPW